MHEIVEETRIQRDGFHPAGSVEQFAEGDEPERERDPANHLSMAILEPVQSRQIVRHVHDLDFPSIVLTALLGGFNVVLHRALERVYVVEHVLVAKPAPMSLVSTHGYPIFHAEMLDVAVLPARCVRLVDGRAEAPHDPRVLAVDAPGEEVDESLVEDAFREAVRLGHPLDESPHPIRARRGNRGRASALVGDEHEVAADDARGLFPGGVGKLRHDVEDVRADERAVLNLDPNDPRSRHVFDFLGMVERVQPRAFVMENVKALARNRRWAGTIADIRKKAEEIGYKTYLDVLNSADHGVPQTRERMFLVGFRDQDVEFEYPKPTVAEHVGVAAVLKSLPPIGQPGNDQTCKAIIITTAKEPVLRPSPFAGMLFNGQGRPMDVNRPAPTLPASMGGNRTPIVDQETFESGSPQWVVGYHDSLMAGGVVAESVPSRLRRISVQEAAAIHSFPSDMPWQGSQSSRYRQIGNAVPRSLPMRLRFR